VAAIEEVRPDLVVGANIADTYPAIRRLRERGRSLPRVAMSLHAIEPDMFADIRANVDLLDAVIASNRLACKLCGAESGVPAERVLYAPYGVNVAGLTGIAQRCRPDSRLRIAWVGRFEESQKQVLQLPRILDELDQQGLKYVLRVAGDGPERASLLSQLSNWIRAGRVEWLGTVPSTEVPDRVYADADLLLMTSTWETGPIVIWEAMAAGVCVVTSRYVGSGLEDALVHENNCLMFDVGDVAEAARQIARTTDVSVRKRLVEAGRQLVGGRYSRERSVESWATAFEAVMRLTPTRPGRESAPARNGRLDRWVGTSAAESLRSFFGVRYPHSSAGGEWPHASSPLENRGRLLDRANSLDRR
jgi:glycosyltransferase involved in cell wall biosynthesis